jgi:ribonuclease-3
LTEHRPAGSPPNGASGHSSGMDELSSQHGQRLAELETYLGYSFKDPALLRQAITHKSFANENLHLELLHNESLEFLGDSILNFVISSQLYRTFAGSSEGELSRFRSYLVSGRHLVSLAREVQLGSFLLLGRGETKTHGHEKQNILIDALEAVIASIFLDGGIRAARAFVLRIFRESLRQLRRRDFVLQDYKTQLQEYLADSNRQPPRYITTGDEGPDHEKTFFVRLDVGGERLGEGQGPSKKAAQQAAAEQALRTLRQRDDAPAPRKPKRP